MSDFEYLAMQQFFQHKWITLFWPPSAPADDDDDNSSAEIPAGPWLCGTLSTLAWCEEKSDFWRQMYATRQNYEQCEQWWPVCSEPRGIISFYIQLLLLPPVTVGELSKVSPSNDIYKAKAWGFCSHTIATVNVWYSFDLVVRCQQTGTSVAFRMAKNSNENSALKHFLHWILCVQ